MESHIALGVLNPFASLLMKGYRMPKLTLSSYSGGKYPDCRCTTIFDKTGRGGEEAGRQTGGWDKGAGRREREERWIAGRRGGEGGARGLGPVLIICIVLVLG